MKERYDFSKGERGKFYCKDAKLHIPVYLDEEVQRYVGTIAQNKEAEISDVVNEMIQSEMPASKPPWR